MKTLEEEALEYFIDTEDFTHDTCIENFIAGAKSKWVQAENIKAQIEVLKDVNSMNAEKLYQERPSEFITRESCIEQWNNTVWAKSSLYKISELEQQLKDLKDEA